jgi:large subunit ribosomal protein L14
MIQIRSRLDVADNTGARMATMIGVIGKRTLVARVGDVITANVKEAATGGTVKKGDVVRAVVVRTRQPVRREDGSVISVSTAMPLSSSTRISIPAAPVSSALSPANFVKRTS